MTLWEASTQGQRSRAQVRDYYATTELPKRHRQSHWSVLTRRARRSRLRKRSEGPGIAFEEDVYQADFIMYLGRGILAWTKGLATI